jgi:WD40 repeat protein
MWKLMLVGFAVVVGASLASDANAQVDPKIEIVPDAPHSDVVTSVTISADGARLLSGSRDATLKLWDVPNRQLIRTVDGHAEGVHSAAFSPDGNSIAFRWS